MADKQIYPMISEKSWWQLRNQFKKTIPSVVNVSYLKSLLSLNSDQSARNILAPLRQMGIIDADGNRLGENEAGELVVTTLTRRGMPVLRYRTKDITKITYEPCKCGRTHARMAKTMGRTDDMLIIKGVNVFPTQIEGALITVDKIGPHYQLIIRRKNFKDTLEIKVELVDASVLESFGDLESLQKKVQEKLKRVLGLQTKVTLVQPKTLERFQGKAKRILDLRNEGE